MSFGGVVLVEGMENEGVRGELWGLDADILDILVVGVPT